MRPETSDKLGMLAAVCLLAGCTTMTYQYGTETISPDDVPDPGQSRGLTDVLAELGPPNRLSATPGGYVLAWESWYIERTKLGLSLMPLGVDLISIGSGNALIQGEYLVLHFSSDHTLVASGYGSSDGNAVEGQGVQPLFSFVDTADVDDMTGPMPHHHWGGFMLNRLPLTINADSHLDAGQNGIQQRGTPAGVGQHSSEMR